MFICVIKNLTLVHRIGVSASIVVQDDQNFSENEIEFFNKNLSIGTYGFLGKIQCKLCVEVMRPVARAIRKDSAKVNLVNYFIKMSISIIKFHFSFNCCLQREIVKALDRACTIIPIRKYRSKCRNSVKKHGEEIANKIGENVDPKKICEFLEFC